MDKKTHSFDDWFDTVSLHVLDACGVDFQDRGSVKEDYENGLDAFDVAESIIDEYS